MGYLEGQAAACPFFVVGRIKDIYISGGENVYPGEVEKQITTHHDIAEAVVVAVPSEKWGEVGFAFLKTEKDIKVEQLREFLNPLLSRYKHPYFLALTLTRTLDFSISVLATKTIRITTDPSASTAKSSKFIFYPLFLTQITSFNYSLFGNPKIIFT